MFMANGWSRRMLQNGDEKKVLSICKCFDLFDDMCFDDWYIY